MSINVTVKGNPVSIKRGKMITTDPQTAKKEFDKRRLLRLEQVRQQSKELAENVRNKVRKEKKKQMGEIEKEGKQKLKNWQNRQLLELQNQYLDALNEIGAGHKDAQVLEDENEILENQRLQNEEAARNRGRLAETKLQVQKNEENYKKAMPMQHKKLVRDIENTRATLVASMQKNEPKKCTKTCQGKVKKSKPLADINITVPNDSDFSEASSSDSSKSLPSVPEEDQSNDSEGFCECSEENGDSSDPIEEETTRLGAKDQDRGDDLQPSPKVAARTSKSAPRTEPKRKSYQETIDERRKLIENFRCGPRKAPADTRISDRINRRQLMVGQPDYCDLVADPTPIPEVIESSRIRDKISSRTSKYFDQTDNPPVKDPLDLTSEECLCTRFHSSCPCGPKGRGPCKSAAVQADLPGGYRQTCKCGPRKETKPGKAPVRERADKSKPGEAQATSRISGRSMDIPVKPPVKLKDVGQATSKTVKDPGSVESTTNEGAAKVRHYDFPNRFERDLPSTAYVERIHPDDVEVIPDPMPESEWQAKMKQRDIDAQVRGKRALEKEKIQKDYEEMMRKLPILQRKEHIARIGTDKPEYHMSEERLREREKERQNRLENAYSQAMPPDSLKPQVVTIPRRRHEIATNDEPFEILDGEDSRVLDLGKWDTDAKPRTMFSAEEVQEIIKAFTLQEPADRKAKLKQLLRSLKLQKEQLINEIRALPRDDSINALIGDLNSFSDTDNKQDRTAKHVKRSKEKDRSDRKRRLEESSDSSVTSAQEAKGTSKSGRKDHPLKKIKKHAKPKVLVLQNTSTQTTPKATKETSSTTTTTSSSSGRPEQADEAPKGIKICTKTHAPCDCFKEGKSSEEVCKIYINLNEEESPKVEVVRGDMDVERKQKGQQREKSPKSPRKEGERPSKPPREERSFGKENKPPKERPKTIEKKSVATETGPLSKPKKKPFDIQAKEQQKAQARSNAESWKEHLSKNSISTSSTSYFSPPDFSKQNTTASTEASRQSMYNLRKKPQQSNIGRSSTLRSSFQFAPEQDPQILNYVKILLAMSRASVDELGVSSSDVQTPSQSVIEMETNNPMAALHNIIRFVNFRTADIARELSVSTDDAQAPPNSSVSASSEIKNQQGEAPEKDSADKTNKESILSQYADVTDCCAQRIANLAAMIEQLRREKIQMLQSPPLAPLAQLPVDGKERCDPSCQWQDRLTPTLSDKDYSTRYMEFPPFGEKSKGTNSTASIEEEELNKRLLEIDMSLAEKLKTFRQGRDGRSAADGAILDQDNQPTATPPVEDQADDTNQQFLERLQRLIDDGQEREQQQEQESPLPENSTQFVPFLVDIPKLPILEPDPEGGQKRHPPPSKGLITAKKFNGNVSLIPHELSTIAEADSQMSTKISPNNSKTFTSPYKDNNNMQPLSPPVEEHSFRSGKSSAENDKNEDTQKMVLDKSVNLSDSNKSFTCTDGTCPNLGSSSTSSGQKSSSSSSGDMRSIENMLKSIGMDWAIPTLHKTQEALALTSSSSSGDLSSKKKSGMQSASCSEVSLKEFLKKQMMSKISSSSLNRSDASPASFVRECSEMSAIQANSSAEKTKQKTSTPVLSSKSTTTKSREEQQLFTGASDISSVKNSSCEGSCKSSCKQTFHSLAGDENSSATKSSVE